MNPLHLILIAITLDSHTGEEIHRQRVPDTPVYESIGDCSEAQRLKPPQYPAEGKITVFMCQPLQGHEQT
jgi:hypothetical protein